jgi:hypothetical protein
MAALLQAIATDFRTMGRTAYQRLFEVEMFRQKKEAHLGQKVSAAALAKMYSDNVKFCPGSDPLSAAFIDEALTVFSRALSISTVRDAVAWCDEAFSHSSPFNSVYKMAAIIKRAGTPDKIEWVFLGIVDWVRRGSLAKEDITFRALSGVSGSRGLVDLLVLKRQMLQHFFAETVPGLKFPSEVTAAMASKLSTHENYTKFVSPYPSQNGSIVTADLSWKVGWSSSADQMLNFVEACAGLRGRGSLVGVKKVLLSWFAAMIVLQLLALPNTAPNATQPDLRRPSSTASATTRP